MSFIVIVENKSLFLVQMHLFPIGQSELGIMSWLFSPCCPTHVIRGIRIQNLVSYLARTFFTQST